MNWRDFETDPPPRDGSEFLTLQDGEVYVAKFLLEPAPRIAWRTHQLFVRSKYHWTEIEYEGEVVEAKIPFGKPWAKDFEHNWTVWLEGFDFKPTKWMELTK